MNQQVEDSCDALAQKKDAVITEAISDVLGAEWTFADIAKRGQFKWYRDGTEVFVLDGKELLVFYPMKIDVDYEGGTVKIKSTVQYRRLNVQSGIKSSS